MAYLTPRGRRSLGACSCPNDDGLGAVISNTLARRVASPPLTSRSNLLPIAGSYTPPTTTPQPRQRRQRGSASGWQNQQGQNWQGQNWQGQGGASSPAVNTGSTPGTIESYDAEGNPVYSVPPPGQSVIGYDISGTPLYGAPPSGTVQVGTYQGLPVYGYSGQSTAGVGTGVTAESYGLQSGTIVGYNSYGQPVYAGSAAAAALQAQAVAATPAAAGAATAPTTTDTSGYSDVLNWFSESTLISGVPNWMLALGVGLAVVVIQSRKGR